MTTGSKRVTVFRTRLRPEHRAEYEATAERMELLAGTMPGFLSIKTFAAADGERVSIVEFSSRETSAHWREQAEHRAAQQLGRERLYAEYRIQVCECLRDEQFQHEAGSSG
jgi:heme-degrading monooxygenase HmoA